VKIGFKVLRDRTLSPLSDNESATPSKAHMPSPSYM
jgi:hypothetical protein